MYPKTSRMFRYLVLASGLFAMIGGSSPSDAYVQKFHRSDRHRQLTPIISGSSIPGPSTSYTIYTGRIFGALNQMILTPIKLSPTSTLRPGIRAGFNTFPISRL